MLAWAVCEACGVGVRWYAGRGCRLTNLKCPRCGGKLRRATYDEARHKPEVYDLATPTWKLKQFGIK